MPRETLFTEQFANARELVDLIVRAPSLMTQPQHQLGGEYPIPNLKGTKVLDRDAVMSATQFTIFREITPGGVTYSIMIS